MRYSNTLKPSAITFNVSIEFKSMKQAFKFISLLNKDSLKNRNMTWCYTVEYIDRGTLDEVVVTVNDGVWGDNLKTIGRFVAKTEKCKGE